MTFANASSRCRTLGFALGAALFAGGAATCIAATSVGTVEGHFSTTATGQAAYTMSLPAPGGAGGLAPHLAIVYRSDSGSGPGIFGHDVTLAGLSKIDRCGPSWPYDGKSAPPTLSEADRFCLDGQELSYSGDVYGGGKRYVATPTRHTLVISHGTNPTTGPGWFEVRHPDGSVWEYGRRYNSRVNALDSEDATVFRLWALDKITDADGNTITFHYIQPSGTGSYYLGEVDWGGNTGAGTSADHGYVFSYETVDEDAKRYRYLVGNKIVRDRRVSKITLKYNGSAVMAWTPAYLADSTGSGRTRLAGLTECAGGDCLPATSFDWQGTPGFSAAQNSGRTGATADTFVADVNGDGREDLVYARASRWRVRLGKVSGGFGGEYNTGANSSHHPGWAQPIHYRPGAADQILYVNINNKWVILAWNGSGFSSMSTGIAASGEAAAADVDGDGYDDLVSYGGSGDHKLYTRLNTARTASPGFGNRQAVYTYSTHDTVLGFEATGHAAARGPERALHITRAGAGVVVHIHHHEVICIRDGCPPGSKKRIIDINRNDALTWSGGQFSPYVGGRLGDGELVPLDVNGDGLTDFVVSGTVTLALNTGQRFKWMEYGSGTSGLEMSKAVAADYNGDGRDDLLVPGTNGDWMLLRSTGSGFAAPADTGTASSAFGGHPVVADTEGRMLADLVGRNGSGNIELALRRGPYPDVLSKITDGLGKRYSLTWVPLSDTGHVKATAATGKVLELARRGSYLLGSLSRDNGHAGSYTKSYVYDTPLIRAGTGYAGIRKSEVTDSRNNHTTSRVFDFDGRFKNGVLKKITVKADGQDIRRDEYDFGNLQEGGTLNMNTRTMTYYDLDGHKLYSVEYAYSFDGYGVPKHIKVTTSANGNTWVHEIKRDPVGIAEFPGYGCVGLSNWASVTNTLPTGESRTRKISYTSDVQHCRYSRIVRNSNLAAKLQTRNTLNYDTFGNLKTVKIVGHKPNGNAMPARTTTYGYDSRGEFRTSVTDPLGETTSATWNAALGVKTSQQTPNGTTKSYAYDGFGRPTRITLPSGAKASMSYNACSGCSGAYYIIRAVRNAAGHLANRHVIYYDSLGQVYARETNRRNGHAYVYTRRNALGQIIRRRTPFYNGNTDYRTYYSYDDLSRLTRVKAPKAGGGDNAITRYAYNGLKTIITDAKGNKTHVTKNPLGQVVKIVDAKGNTTSYQYGPFGRVTRIKGPDNVIRNVNYNGAGHRTSLAAPDLGGALHFKTNSLGEVTWKKDAASRVTTFEYDKLGRMTAENFPGSGGQDRSWTYATSGHAAGRLVEATRAGGFSRAISYNALGQPDKVKQTVAGAAWTMHYGYDSLGRVASVTYPFIPPPDAPKRLGAPTPAPNPSHDGAYTVSWSSAARATSYRLGENSGGDWSQVYKGSARHWSASGKSSGTYSYRVRPCNESGCAKWSDTANESVAIPPGGAGSLSLSPNPSHDGAYTVSWGASTRATSYRLQENAKSTGWSRVYSGSARHWSASGKSNGTYKYRLRPCNAGGCSDWSATATETVARIPATPTNFHREGSGTVQPGANYMLAWDGAAYASSYQLAKDGTTPTQTGISATHKSETAPNQEVVVKWRLRACGGEGCSAWSGPLSLIVFSPPPPPCRLPPCRPGGLAVLKGGGFAPAGQSSALTVNYRYDAWGNLASVKNAHTGTVYWQADTNASIPAVNAFGVVQAWTLGNGVDVRREQDPATGAVSAIMAGPSHNASLVSLAYGYGPAGNVSEAYDVLTGRGFKRAGTRYDSLKRLTRFNMYSHAGIDSRTANYGPGGNLTWRNGNQGGHYYYNASMPHAVTKIIGNGRTTHYHYNGVGEMASGGDLTSIQWSRGGRVTRLIGDQTTKLTYGAQGQLVTKTVGGTESRYFGKRFVKVGGTWRERIVAQGEVIAVVKIDVAGVASTHYLVHDAQGSLAAMLDEQGNLEARFAYNAWGELIDPQTGAYPDPGAAGKHALTTLGYTGHEALWSAGLVHTYARLYNPAIGRWLSPDPTIPNLYNGQSLNRYSYVLNNPLTFVDPRGLETDLPPITVVGHCAWCAALRRIRRWTQHYWAYMETLESEYSNVSYGGHGGGGSGPSGGNNKPSQKQNKKNPCGKVPNHPKDADIYSNIAFAMVMRRLNSTSISGKAIDYVEFGSMVREGGPWDYKRGGRIQYENFGNFNYGATGNAWGIPEGVLLRMAGAVQEFAGPYNPENGHPLGGPPYGDQSTDQVNIKAGVSFSNCVMSTSSGGS